MIPLSFAFVISVATMAHSAEHNNKSDLPSVRTAIYDIIKEVDALALPSSPVRHSLPDFFFVELCSLTAKVDEPQTAARFLTRIQNEQTRQECRREIIRILASQGHIQDALKLTEESDVDGAWLEYSQFAAGRPDFDKALIAVDSIASKYVRCKALLGVCQQRHKRDEKEKSYVASRKLIDMLLLDESREYLASGGDVGVGNLVYHSVEMDVMLGQFSKLAVATGRVDEAFLYATRIQELGRRADGVLAVCTECVRNRSSNVQDVLMRVRERVDVSSGSAESHSRFVRVIAELDLNSALKYSLDNGMIGIEGVAERLGTLGEERRVQQIIESTLDDTQARQAAIAAARGYIAIGKVDSGRSAIEEASKRLHKSAKNALQIEHRCEIACLLSRCGENGLAKTMVSRAIEDAGLVDVVEPVGLEGTKLVGLLRDIAKTANSIGELSTSTELFQRCWESAGQVNDPLARQFLREQMILVCAESGRVTLAQQFVSHADVTEESRMELYFVLGYGCGLVSEKRMMGEFQEHHIAPAFAAAAKLGVVKSRLFR